MIKRRRITSLFVMLIVLALSIQTSFGSADFSDVKTTDWYYQNVQTLVNDPRGIIKGYPDGSFMPLEKLTLDQFLTMCVRVAGYNLENSEGYWAQNNIDKAMELEFIFPGEFLYFTEEVTREEMSLIISRVLENQYGPQDYTGIEKVNDVVLDSDEFTSRFEDSIQLSYKLGIITGYPDHTFKPQEVLTRSQASAVIVRVIDEAQRIAFDYDALYEDLYGDVESHLLGGSNWVDPTTASALDNAYADKAIIKSDILFSPTDYQIEANNITKISIDDVSAAFMYDENGPLAGHIEDIENLLLRRMEENEVDKVMEYIAVKTNSKTYLSYDEAIFYLDNNRYIVRLDEVLVFEGTEYESAGAVNFNIWFRDSDFINEYEANIVEIQTNEDKVIYR